MMNLSCPACGATENFSLVHDQLRYDHPGRVYKCPSCEFVFLYPRLSIEEQNRYYQEVYRDEYEDTHVSERFISDAPEASRRLEKIKKEPIKIESLLEIGSGSGAFLSLVSKDYPKVAGVELDLKTQVFLKEKGLKVVSSLDDLDGEKFDAIVLFHVLEHFLDPEEFLKNLSRHMHENSAVFIEVPNIDDALVSLYNIDEFKSFYFCTAHVSYFSKKTLLDCCSRAGLDAEISLIQRYDLNNHLHWMTKRKPELVKSDMGVLSEKTLKSYEQDLVSNGWSDTLWAVVRKK